MPRGGQRPVALAAALWRFWQARGHWSEGRAWLEKALAGHEEIPLQAHAEALLGAGALAFPQGDDEQATRLLEQALALFRALDDPRGLGDTLTTLGNAATNRADHAAAATWQEEALAMFRLAGNREGIADALHNLGNVFFDLGDLDRAVSLLGRKPGLGAGNGAVRDLLPHSSTLASWRTIEAMMSSATLLEEALMFFVISG